MTSWGKDLPVFLKVLGSQSPLFESEEDIQAYEEILKQLSEDEVEAAANTSYAYWAVSKKAKDQLPVKAREYSALKEIRRHWVGENRKQDKALAVLKDALHLREERCINLLRLCFHPEDQKEWDLTADEMKFVSNAEAMIQAEQGRQKQVVRGTAQKMPIAYKPERNEPTSSDHDEAYIMAYLYATERCCAAAEFTSAATVEKTIAIYGFTDYISGYSVSLSATKTASTLAQRIYPERLKKMFIVDPPFYLRIIISLVLPILSRATREKVSLVIGVDKLVQIFKELTGDENSEVVQMLENGTYSSSVDNHRYLTEIPFYHLYENAPES